MGSEHSEIKDLFRPKVWLYWTDFTFSAFMTHAPILWVSFAAHFTWFHAAVLVCPVYFGMRSGNFLHELQHGAKGIKGFELWFNLVWGWPFRFPSYIYDLHVRHHQTSTYATLQDTELDSWGNSNQNSVLPYLWHDLLYAPLVYFRFGIFPLLSFLFADKFVDKMYASASSFGANAENARDPRSTSRARWVRSDTMCSLFTFASLGLSVMGYLPWFFHLITFIVSVTAMLVTQMQTYAFHFYETKQESVAFLEQLRDTLNYPHILSEIWAPLNARFHLLHHMYPMLPYHSLPEAHRRLISILPKDHIYILNQAHLLPRLLLTRSKSKGLGDKQKESA